MIEITLQQIKDKNPCASGWRKVKQANIKRDMSDKFLLSTILESNDLSDTLWALRCVPNGKQIAALFALWCAKQAAKNTDNKAVHECVSCTEKYLNAEASLEVLMKARAAVAVAVAVAHAADAAAAAVAAHAAAHAAVAAHAAADAADAADAGDAADAAAAHAAVADTADAADAADAGDAYAAHAAADARADQAKYLKQLLDN